MGTKLDRRGLLFGGAAALVATAAEVDIATGALADWRSIVRTAHLSPAFEYLEKTDLTALATGRHNVDGDRMFITITKAPSRRPESAKFETHRRYTDIHVLISGPEMIGAARGADLQIATPYNDKNDIELYDLPGTYRHIRMQPRHFAVFLPGQAHLPGCHEDKPGEIYKAVMKVLSV